MTTRFPFGRGRFCTGHTGAEDFKEVSCDNGARVVMAKPLYNFNKHPELATVSYELSCTAIPFERIIELVNFLPYGHPIRVITMFLFLTGCRLKEYELMELQGKDSFIKGNWVFWKVGKNQSGWRKEFLPTAWLKEYEHYRNTQRLYKGKMFAWSGETLGRYFNKLIRSQLSPAWQERVSVPRNIGGQLVYEYVLQIKGFRKSFATIIFWEQWEKYGDAAVALEMVCKRLKHSSHGMTVQHYISNSERLNYDKWRGYMPGEILGFAVSQTHLSDFNENLLVEGNRQDSLVEYQ